MPTATVELEGHIIDSGLMARCFGAVMDMDGSFEVETFEVGRHKDEHSYCRMSVSADDPDHLREIVHELNQNGATIVDPEDATLEPAPADRVVPAGFYSTTNHPTFVRIDGEWRRVEHPEMDCAILVEDGQPHTAPLYAVEAGDLVVTGETGIRVEPPERPRSAEGPFGFMRGGVSGERPSGSLIRQIAGAIEETRERGGNVLLVPGPAVHHAGAGADLARIVRAGHVDALSAGNGFAVHDVERALFGTSLGVDVETMEHPRTGHRHHVDAISAVRRAGSIEAAVEDGVVDEGVLYECVQHDVPYVLAGSIRDDGPLPDTITDSVAAQQAIREQAREADFVLMLATLLHSVAVGNCLPSTARVVCVDIDQSTVTQLVDRGSAQATGMVTDVGTFVPTLADHLLAE
jgi:lysine-ketoglutarate reductase/saccharopine dehydrogenase-like protein (TIGR00300 family)